MTAPFAKLVNENHNQMVLLEKQDQAIKLVASKRVRVPANKKKAGWVPEVILAVIFIVAIGVAFYMATGEHHGVPSFDGTPVSEMSISEQLKMAEEVRYND